MKYVLDASVAFKWFVPEVNTDKAIVLRDDFRNAIYELIAPEFFPVECTHSITRAERQGRITQAQGLQALADLLAMLPNLHSALPLLPRADEISSSMRVGVYDCIYVGLAERENCELVTGDDKLVKTLQPMFPFIIPLASMP